MKELDRSRPLIYVTLGSTAQPALFRKILRIFAENRYQVVMTTGGQIDLPEQDIPRNFRLEKYLPGEQMMEFSDLVIHHGGAGTVYQTIKMGTPSVVVATHFEQEFHGEVLEEHGAGIFLTMKEVMANPALVIKAVETILQNPNPYRENIRKLQEDLKRYHGVRAAADSIEAFITTRIESSLSP